MSLAEKFNFNHLEDLIDENEFAKFCSKYRCLSGISQVNFLCNMIRYKKLPNDQDIKNVVEIGTDFGITSYFMLKTGVEKYGDNFDLHAFDINSGDFVASAIYENAPDKYTKNFVVYTGTHDNMPLFQYISDMNDSDLDKLKLDLIKECKNLNVKPNISNIKGITKTIIELAFASIADIAIIPMQDLLCQDKFSRMNLPSTVSKANWSYRISKRNLTDALAERLCKYVVDYRR